MFLKVVSFVCIVLSLYKLCSGITVVSTSFYYGTGNPLLNLYKCMYMYLTVIVKYLFVTFIGLAQSMQVFSIQSSSIVFFIFIPRITFSALPSIMLCFDDRVQMRMQHLKICGHACLMFVCWI